MSKFHFNRRDNSQSQDDSPARAQGDSNDSIEGNSNASYISTLLGLREDIASFRQEFEQLSTRENSILGERIKSNEERMIEVNTHFIELGSKVEQILVMFQNRLKNLENRSPESMRSGGAVSYTERTATSNITTHLESIESNITALLDHITKPTSVPASTDSLNPPNTEHEQTGTHSAEILPSSSIPAEFSIPKFASTLDTLSSETRGNARLMAVQLTERLLSLRDLSREIEVAQEADFSRDEWVRNLDRLIFRLDIGVQWSDLTEEETPPYVKSELRELRAVVEGFATLLQGRLRDKHGFEKIRIVVGETRFDTERHESSDFFSTPTANREQDNLLRAVEQNGYELRGRILCRALVRRWLWQEPAQTSVPSPINPLSDTPVVSESVSKPVSEPVQSSQGLETVEGEVEVDDVMR